jgi:dienelactone hydrolase
MRHRKRGSIIAALALSATACSPSGFAYSENEGPRKAPREAVVALAAIRPSGEFSVGVKDISSGGLNLWLYYPAKASSKRAAEPALPAIFAAALTRRFGADAAAALASPYGHAVWGAAPAETLAPLLVFSPGAGLGARAYLTVIETLASRGYAVVALNPTESPAASEERYREAADEIGVAVDAARALSAQPFWGGHVDPSRVGLIGHSLGGAAAVLAMSTAHAQAAVNLDGDYIGAARVNAPRGAILQLVGEYRDESPVTQERRAADWKLVAGHNSSARAYQLRGFRHLTFTDAALVPAPFIPGHARRDRLGSIPGVRAHDIVVKLVSAFFDENLRGKQGKFVEALRNVPEAGRPAGL